MISAGIISLTYTLIDPTVFKCERLYQGTRSGKGYKEGDPLLMITSYPYQYSLSRADLATMDPIIST